LPPAEAYKFSLYHTGVFEVAKVFGRSPGCDNADADLITDTNDAAIRAGIDPRIMAAVIVNESGCNQYAISSRGAVGLMQVNVAIWKNLYDFKGNVNLLNRHDNLQVGAQILSRLVYAYGVNEGIRRYNGLGVDCSTCDPSYVQKILNTVRKN
jgi:soluble lytic murein transglycosylase-like protein